MMAFTKRFTFVLHDETVNTYGFRMLTSGANLEEFRKNPVILLKILVRTGSFRSVVGRTSVLKVRRSLPMPSSTRRMTRR